MDTDPPDPKPTLASLVKKTSKPDPPQELSDSALEFCGKIKARFYYIGSRINRQQLVRVLNEKFKSLAYETYAFYEAEG